MLQEEKHQPLTEEEKEYLQELHIEELQYQRWKSALHQTIQQNKKSHINLPDRLFATTRKYGSHVQKIGRFKSCKYLLIDCLQKTAKTYFEYLKSSALLSDESRFQFNYRFAGVAHIYEKDKLFLSSLATENVSLKAINGYFCGILKTHARHTVPPHLIGTFFSYPLYYLTNENNRLLSMLEQEIEKMKLSDIVKLNKATLLVSESITFDKQAMTMEKEGPIDYELLHQEFFDELQNMLAIAADTNEVEPTKRSWRLF